MTRFRLAAAAGSLVAALTAGMVAGLAPAASAAPPRPVPGAPGIGDPLFPDSATVATTPPTTRSG